MFQSVNVNSNTQHYLTNTMIAVDALHQHQYRSSSSDTAKHKIPLHLMKNADLDTTAPNTTPEEEEQQEPLLHKNKSLQQQQRRARVGDVVTVELRRLRPSFENVEPLFDLRGSVSFVLGAGNYLPGLHDLLVDSAPGDARNNVLLDAGWGDVDPALLYAVPTDRMPSLRGIEVGARLYLQQTRRHCVVTEVTEDVVVFDANPPLAGAYYDCDVTLTRVETCPPVFHNPTTTAQQQQQQQDDDGRYEVATFALGCFWSGELAFMRTPGVVGTKVGYTQGHAPHPSYDDVCAGTTGHTEAVMVVYDPDLVSFRKLVGIAVQRLGDDVYLLDQVGNDQGTQYRHGIYYHTPRQRTEAEDGLRRLGQGVKTELRPATDFYDAEDFHQQYLLKGGQSAKKNAKERIRCYG